MACCAAFLLTVFPSRARALTLTAVNDTLLSLEDSTMPVRLGGELYVPYEVFTQLGVEAEREDDLLHLSAGEETLSFSPAHGYVYDQNQNSYASPAYDRNNTVYVPVKLCCGKFGLGYSTISVSGETILRITDFSAQSDSAFTASHAETIENAIEAYHTTGSYVVPSTPDPDTTTVDEPDPAPVTPAPEPEPEPVVPVTPAQPEPAPEPMVPQVPETPVHKPIRVYLSFFGAPGAHTAEILEALQETGQPATFFLSAIDPFAWQDDMVRRIVAEGHSPALLLEASAYTTPEELIQQADAANRRLALLTGLNTRILSCTTGFGELSAEQRDALIHAGYRLWDTTMDANDDVQPAELAYAGIVQQFTVTDTSVVLRLHHSASAAPLLHSLTAYMDRQNIPAGRITLYATPLNDVSDPR